MSAPLRVLILEDRPEDAELMLHELRRAGFDPAWQRVETEPDYLAQLHEGLDVILADYTLPQFDALRALQLLQEHGLDIPLIIVSGLISEESAIECVKQGAADYLLKDRLARLGPALTHALQEKKLRDEKRRAEMALWEEAQVSAALARVGRELIALLDTPTILDRLCQLITKVLACDCSHTFLWQAEREALVAGYGDTPEQRETLRVVDLPRRTVAPLLARLEREEVVQIVMTEPQNFLPATLPMQYSGITVSLYMALRRGGEIIGVQSAGYRGRQEPFTSQQKRIARGIAQLASLALNNAQLFGQAETANRLKTDFLATMSHELRTPLHIIMGYTGLLLEDEFGGLAPEQANVLQRVDQSAKQLFDLITATLDVSRLEAGRLPVEVEEVDLPQLLGELEAETQDLLREKPQLSFAWQVTPGLPLLRTDRAKLKVILKNLISNAVKFTDEGSVTVDAHLWERGVEIYVTDTGVGIAAEVLPEIFEMFRQADSSMTRLYRGVGLGLYIVRRLLELLRGTVAVESAVGRGSTFRVWVPLRFSA